MISNRPYLIRAIYDWIVDNEWTPHFQIDANYPGVQVPQQFVHEGVIVLNAHPQAVFGLLMDNDGFSFKARFQGVEESVYFPPESVLAVFARENGQGMPFPPEPYPNIEDEVEDSNPTLSAVDAKADNANSNAGAEDDKGSVKKKPSKKKPTLSVVK